MTNGRRSIQDMKRPPTMREIMSHTAGFGYGLADQHPVDKLYREKGVLGANGLADDDQTHRGHPADVPARDDVVVLLRRRHPGLHRREAVGPEVRRVPPAADLHAAEDDRHRVLCAADKADRLAAVYAGNPKTGKIEEAKDLFGTHDADYLEPPSMESGGGGLVGTIGDYARFAR